MKNEEKADGLPGTPGREESHAMRLQPPPDNAGIAVCARCAEPLGPELLGDPLTSQLLDLIRLMPDAQTQVIVEFIADMRAIRANAEAQSACSTPPEDQPGNASSSSSDLLSQPLAILEAVIQEMRDKQAEITCVEAADWRLAAEVQCWIDKLDTARCDLLEAKG